MKSGFFFGILYGLIFWGSCFNGVAQSEQPATTEKQPVTRVQVPGKPSEVANTNKPEQVQSQTVETQPAAVPSVSAQQAPQGMPTPVPSAPASLQQSIVTQQTASPATKQAVLPTPEAKPAATPKAVSATPVAPVVTPEVKTPEKDAAKPRKAEPQKAAEKSVVTREQAPAAKPVVPVAEVAKPMLLQEKPIVSVPRIEEKKESALPVEAEEVSEEKTGDKKTAEPEGIDTIDQESGNWLLKRMALENTIDVIEKINKIFIDIFKTRMDYLVRRNKADRDADIFVNEIGFALGDLSQLLQSLEGILEQEREKQGDLTEEEREALEKLDKKIADVKQLQGEIKILLDVNTAIDDVVMQMEKEIDKSNTYQMQAWKNFQIIKKTLSDEKAEELYLQTEGLYKNLQDIKKYLSDTLQNYFNTTIAKQKDMMNKIRQSVDSLKQSGIDLQEEVQRFAQQTEEIEQEIERQVPIEAAPMHKETWFDYVAMVWRYPLQKAADFWHYIKSFFIAAPTPLAKPAEQKIAKQPEQSKA